MTKSPSNSGKLFFMRLYFCFLNVQQMFKKHFLNIGSEFNNIYFFITFSLLAYEIFKISGVQINQSSQLFIHQVQSNYYSNQCEKSQVGVNLNFKNTLVLKQSNLASQYENLPNKISNTRRISTRSIIQLGQNDKQENQLLDNTRGRLCQIPFNTNRSFDTRINITRQSKLAPIFKLPHFRVSPVLDLPISFKNQSKLLIFSPIRQNIPISDSQNIYANKFFIQHKGRFYLKFTHITEPTIHESNLTQSKDQVLSDSTFTKKNNLFSVKPITPFVDLYEPISKNSYSIILSFGFILLFIRIFQNIYKEYGKEILIVFFDILQLIGLIDEEEWFKDDLNLHSEKTRFKSIRKVNCNLYQIAGIESIILEISEIVWFLRTKKQSIYNPFNSILNITKKYRSPFELSHSYLFIGPPGTGKTLLVQAIAGESGVPILIQSGSILKTPRQHGKGSQTLQSLFQRARRITPCIIFIDEIDGIGARRENISLTSSGEYDFMEVIDNQLNASLNINEVESEKSLNFEDWETEDELWSIEDEKQKVSLNVLQKTEKENVSRTENLAILTQLLIELDGVRSLTNILVIGATNRRTILDPALLRPGRFNHFLHINLPNEKKRMQLFKMSIKKVGYNTNILWSYLARRTEGLSAAAITAIVNESALISIRQNQFHTLQSIEQGILRITTLPNRQLLTFRKKENKFIKEAYLKVYDNFFKKTERSDLGKISILSLPFQRNLNLHLSNYYYRAGKSLFAILFENMPSESLLSINDRKKNFRYQKLNSVLTTIESDLNYKSKLEEKLIFLLAGKATEMVANQISLKKNQYKYNNEQSIFRLLELANFGETDMKQAMLLVRYMVGKWYLYSEQVITEKYHNIETKYDRIEYGPEELSLMKAIAEDINSQISLNDDKQLEPTKQKWLYNPWWQKTIQEQLNFVNSDNCEWYRIYLSDPDQSEQNIEWVPPDLYYHAIQTESISPYFAWNDLLASTYHYLSNSLMLNAFNTAFNLMKNSTELLDVILNRLLLQSTLREDELVKIIHTFHCQFSTQSQSQINYPTEDCRIIRKSWGKHSRRKIDTKIFIEKIQQAQFEIIKSEDQEDDLNIKSEDQEDDLNIKSEDQEDDLNIKSEDQEDDLNIKSEE